MDVDLRRPDDCFVSHYQRLGLALFIEPDPSQVNAAVEASVPVAGLGREPAEEFTSTLEIVWVDFLPAGQSPATMSCGLPTQQHRDECTPHLAAFTVVAQKRLRMVLDDGLPVFALYHDRKFGHDTESLRHASRSEVPSKLREFLHRQLVRQVQRKRELKYVSHSRTG
ncbi:hypothetical protein AQI88_24700 [Streptomyces cellostaticus]|uniref:Uncharacterized protein n=1 Tax=Streptomyces cellostaticus TaxID=67285 RepID=A0A101NIR7_9ACTN|nr:hypothetical protein AQI88_24700 [Streptomyces cellostaticus]